MTTIKRTLATGVPALSYSVGSGAVVTSALLSMNKIPAPKLAAALPYWGLVQSSLEVVGALIGFIDDFDEFTEKSRLTKAKRVLYDAMTIMANVELFNLSMKSLATGSMFFLYQGMVITSALKLVQSIGDLIIVRTAKNRINDYNDYAEKEERCLVDVCYQTAKLAGWSLLIAGNPVGLAFLGACSLVTLKQLQNEYAPRLFSIFDHSYRPVLREPSKGYTFTYSYPNR